MSEREPGQLAYEAWMRARYSEPELRWDIEPRMSQQRWAAVESAIRSDEAAKVRAATIEDCAKVVEAMIDKEEHDLGDRAAMALTDAVAAIRLKVEATAKPPRIVWFQDTVGNILTGEVETGPRMIVSPGKNEKEAMIDEQAIRADERAKVIEECAKAIEPFVRAWDIACQRLSSGSVAEYEAMAKHHLDGAAFSRLAAIRAKGAEHG